MQLVETCDFLKSKINDFVPEIAIILGSGLGAFTDGLDGIRIKYSDIPHFGQSNVQGHKGELLFTEINNKKCAIMQGRFHFYEGNPMSVCTYPIKVLKKLGVKYLFITNAAGGINKSYNVGDIVLINDHINLMGINPLIGRNDETLGERFPDMTEVYSEELEKTAFNCAQKLNIELKKGVYIAVTGPSYETKAEIKAFSLLGADVVGMSTVPEAIVAKYLNIKTVALSLVTNFAAGVSETKPNHDEVLQIGAIAAKKISDLVKLMIESL